MYSKVIDFNIKVLGIEPKEKPSVLNQTISAHLYDCLLEEVNEFYDSNTDIDIIGCVDALIDLIYFALGGIHKLGLTEEQFEKCFQLVHEHNMRKVKGVVAKRHNGSPDAAKPTNWEPPEKGLYYILFGNQNENNYN